MDKHGLAHGSTPLDLANKVPADELMSTMEACNVFHSVPVQPMTTNTSHSSHLGVGTNMIVPQGWLASGDAYTHQYDQITSDIDQSD